MSQQVINVGALPNDQTGDPIRTAFTKVNENFTEIFTTGGVSGFSGVAGSNTQIQYNASGHFAASSGLVFDYANNILNVGADAGVIHAGAINLLQDSTEDQPAIAAMGNVCHTPTDTGLLQLGEELTFFDINILATASANVDNYIQFVLQNRNTGENAATDFIVNNDQGSADNYGDFGINSSNFVGNGGAFSDPGATYLYSSNNSLIVGTIADDNLILATNNIARFSITATGHANVGPLANLTITGGHDGQIIQTDGAGNLKWATNLAVPAGFTKTFYLDSTASTGDNFTLTTSPSLFPEVIVPVAVNIIDDDDGIGFIHRFVSPAIGTDTLAAGTWTFENWVSVDDISNSNKVVVRVNRRIDVDGVFGEFTGTGIHRTFTITSGDSQFDPGDVGDGTILTSTLIETPTQSAWIAGYISPTEVIVQLTDPDFVNVVDVPLAALYYHLFNTLNESPEFVSANNTEHQTVTIVQPEFTGLYITDRIVAAYFGVTTSPTDHTFSLYFAGARHYSYITTPFADSDVSQTIQEGVTTFSPSEDAVYTALNSLIVTKVAYGNSYGLTSNQVIFEAPAATFDQGSFQVNTTNLATGDVQNVTLAACRNHINSNVYFNGYGNIASNGVLAALTMDLNSGNVRLLCSPAVSDTLTHFIAYTITFDGNI